MKFRKIPLILFLLILALGVPHAEAKKQPKYGKYGKYGQAHQLTAEQAALIQRAATREKVLIKNIQQRTPLVETYIQDTRPDVHLYQVPVSDSYTLSRVDFSKTFFDKTYEPRSAAARGEKQGWFKGSLNSITGLTKLLGLEKFTYSPTGFMQMMFLDPTSFDQQHYVFSFVRREFLGSVRTWVYDVHPKPETKGMGRFYGRIWVEDQDGNVVRFNGTYTGPTTADSSKYYFHFDSWRMNVQPGVWLPVAVYVEETQRTEGRKSVGLKAQTHFWGYSLKLPTHDSENVSVKVDDAEDKSDDSADVGPLQASRMWVTQAENNVIDRLVEAGLVAPLNQTGYETKVLDQIVVNLIVPNNLAFTDQIRTRVLLTDTVEVTTVGNTILLSKGLIDSLPSEEAIASVLAMELAHIALGHHIDTRYAFNDRLLFPDESSFQRIDMYHSDHDNTEAAKKALEYLNASMYKDKLPSAALYYAQLVDRAKVLKQLNSPKLGDSLLKQDGTPWMAELWRMSPKLDWDDLTQTAALPLGSWLKTDPWDDKVHMLTAKRYAPMNARDKMPFEVTPIFYKLQRYEVANAPAATPAEQPAAQPATQPEAQPATQPEQQQPAATPTPGQ
ncbi:M48 family metalloprotease [Telmatobacter bradus]|uniref:M48 family metalloprotease n=1 Tax=Telmatobacter bradus TaxID=474953 RepID=UPI003B4328C3